MVMKLRSFLLVSLLGLPFSALSAQWLVGFAQDTLGNDWRLKQVEEVRAVLESHPDVEFVVTDARGEVSLQARQIRQLVDRGIDLLITSPRDQVILGQVIRQVHEQGIPVILLSRTIEGEGYTSLVTANNTAIARQAGEYLAEQLAGQGRVLMLEGVAGASTTQARSQGFLQVMAEYPGIQVVTRTANYLRADAIQVLRHLLSQGESFDAIYAHSDSMATGARMALTQAGLDPADLLIVGIDYIAEAREALLAGEQDLSFTYPTGGHEGALLALEILEGGKVPARVELETQAVTPELAETLEPIF
ncbi:substrate-binding domain-containing protein [Marinospirillum perlucidum]|uniref:substrate-binding domain-containing protein n=1 Tax=Marinospirillum perlucidum TaxID=1982602 RepID=UPI000DF19925|nr:substrate-binding domain-containing protein [Marinospirillum perlucidum]